MSDLPFKAAFILGLVAQIVIRAPIDRLRRFFDLVQFHMDTVHQVFMEEGGRLDARQRIQR